jgi:hypothetical protein
LRGEGERRSLIKRSGKGEEGEKYLMFIAGSCMEKMFRMYSVAAL